jgi:L-fucose isomerase-like protein
MHETNDTIMKLRILARAEVTLARINLQRTANRAKLYAIAIGLGLLAVVMVNIGAYQLLAETYGNAVAAFLLAAGNGALAGAVLLAVSRLQPGPEEKMVQEIREMALAEVTADVEEMKADFTQLGADVKRIQTGFSALSSGGGIGTGLAGLMPVISMIIDAAKHLRKGH